MTLQTKIISIKPSIKALWFLSSMIVFFTDNFIIIFLVTIVSLFLYLATKSYKTIYNLALLGVIPLIAAILILGFWVEPDFNGGIFMLTSILKWCALGFSAIVFFVIVRPFEIKRLLERCHCPASFSIALNASFRFIPIIIEEWRKIFIAQQARGLPALSFRRFYLAPQIVGAVSIPLLINIAERTEQMYYALSLKDSSIDSQPKKETLTFFEIIISVYLIAIVSLAFILQG